MLADGYVEVDDGERFIADYWLSDDSEDSGMAWRVQLTKWC